MTGAKIKDTDGGYYAIKGFTFQFDKTIDEIIKNKGNTVYIEQVQDLSRDDYYIQVKHKEASTYTPSTIKKPVMQLLDDFRSHGERSYALYCYFKDQVPAEKTLTVAELNRILGDSAGMYETQIKENFVKKFTLQYSVDFTKQFRTLIADIVSIFGLKSEEEGVLYHAIFRAELLRIASLKKKSDRETSYASLKELIDHSEKIIFDIAYSKFLSKNNYLAYIKSNFFTFKGVNIPSDERLFEIRLKGDESVGKLVDVIKNISRRFYIHEQSPAPYIHLVGISQEKQNLIKQRLWSEGSQFVDGTNFVGDKFRLEEIKTDIHNKKSNIKKFKFVDNEHFYKVVNHIAFDQKIIFICDDSTLEPIQGPVEAFHMSNVDDILRVIR